MTATSSETMNQPIRTNRLSWVDYARGLAILFVVYRHVVIGLDRSGKPVPGIFFQVQDVFVNFRMPVFFILSGVFLAASLRRRSWGSILRDRAFTLLYPYILWGVITLLLQIMFTQFANARRSWGDLAELATNPRELGALWYLLALFNTSLLFLLLQRLITDRRIQILIAAILHVISMLPQLRAYNLLTDLCHFYTYFLIGTLISEALLDSQVSPRLLSTRRLAWVLPLVLVGQFVWYTHREQESLAWVPVFLLINLLGCLLVYMIAFRISGWHAARWLAFIGRYSLYIYILHIYIAAITRAVLLRVSPEMHSIPLMIACMITGIAIPILIIRVLSPYGAGWLFSLKPKTIA